MKKTLSWGVALMCASTFHASADSAEDQVLVERFDSMYTALDAIEVTANRAGVKTPVAFTNVTAKDIAKGNDGRDIPSLLEMTPSIISIGDAGAGIGYSSLVCAVLTARASTSRPTVSQSTTVRAITSIGLICRISLPRSMTYR